MRTYEGDLPLCPMHAPLSAPMCCTTPHLSGPETPAPFLSFSRGAGKRSSAPRRPLSHSSSTFLRRPRVRPASDRRNAPPPAAALLLNGRKAAPPPPPPRPPASFPLVKLSRSLSPPDRSSSLTHSSFALGRGQTLLLLRSKKRSSSSPASHKGGSRKRGSRGGGGSTSALLRSANLVLIKSGAFLSSSSWWALHRPPPPPEDL